MKILVLDDFSTMRRITRNMLSEIGYGDVEGAIDGIAARPMLRGAHYGLVISDWTMEPMTGLQFLMEVRADDKLKAIPVIPVTGGGHSENADLATQAGACEILPKPFDAETLKQKIDAVLRR